jgi:hypothetical protein
MSHLSSSEFVDLAEGTLDPERAAHASGCDACRAEAAVVHDALRMIAASGHVPDPSPLFWDQLSARVRDGIAAPPPRSPFGFSFALRSFQPVVAVLALAVAIFSVALVTRDARRAVPSGDVATTAPGARAGEPGLDADLTPEVTHAEEWAVLTAAAADLELDDARAAGMAVQSAAIDRAVQRLNEAELTELGRLLQTELKRSSN